MSNAWLGSGSKYEVAGTDASNSRPVTLGTSYTELVSATTFDWEGFFATGYNISTSDTLNDIAIGAASSEEIIIEDLMMSGTTGVRVQGHSCYFPIKIPSGTRLSGRADNASAARIQLHGVSNGPAGYSPGVGKSVRIGASGGLTVSVAGTAHTKGSYQQITNSTTQDFSGLIVNIMRSSSVVTTASYFLDVSVGAASSEVVVLPDLCLASEAISDSYLPEWQGYFPCAIPAGTRLAARAQCNLTGINLKVQLHGIPA